MNKNIIKLIGTVAIAAAIAACNSGSSGGSSSPALVLTQVTGPVSSGSPTAPAQNLGAGIGSGSLFADQVTGNTLYLMGNANGSVYAPLNANTQFTGGTSIIGGWLSSYGTTNEVLFGPDLPGTTESVAAYYTASLTTPLSTTSTNTASLWQAVQLSNVNRTLCFGAPNPGTAGSPGCAGSNSPSNARLITSNTGNTQFIFAGYGQSSTQGAESIGYSMTSSTPYSSGPLTPESYISLASCVAQGSGTVPGESATVVSSIAASSLQGYQLFIGGTNSGDVCVGVLGSGESTAFQNFNGNFYNLPALANQQNNAGYIFESASVTQNGFQVTGGYNQLGAVNAIAATPPITGNQNTTTLIAWTQGTSGVYASSITNIAGPYTLANLTSSAYTNVPSNVSVIYVDSSNNIYVGTFNNLVYVLPNGSTTWLSASLPSTVPTGTQIYNFSEGYSGTVYVYTANGGANSTQSPESSTVFSVNF